MKERITIHPTDVAIASDANIIPKEQNKIIKYISLVMELKVLGVVCICINVSYKNHTTTDIHQDSLRI